MNRGERGALPSLLCTHLSKRVLPYHLSAQRYDACTPPDRAEISKRIHFLRAKRLCKRCDAQCGRPYPEIGEPMGVLNERYGLLVSRMHTNATVLKETNSQSIPLGQALHMLAERRMGGRGRAVVTAGRESR